MIPSLARRVADAQRFATVPAYRRAMALRRRRPTGLFQPFGDTAMDRYPEVFGFLERELGDRPDCRVLSFGCSTGEEVLTLRRLLPRAHLTGIDISRGNVRAARRRVRRAGLGDVDLRVGGSPGDLPPGHFDAVLAMAVLRHGDLAGVQAERCDHRLTFARFEAAVAELAAVVREGGLLCIEHSNFRFCDTATSAAFTCVLTVPHVAFDDRTPLFGPDDHRLAVPSYDEVVFRRTGATPPP